MEIPLELPSVHEEPQEPQENIDELPPPDDVPTQVQDEEPPVFNEPELIDPVPEPVAEVAEAETGQPEAEEPSEISLLLDGLKHLSGRIEAVELRQPLVEDLRGLVTKQSDVMTEIGGIVKKLRTSVRKMEEDQITLANEFVEMQKEHQADREATMVALRELQQSARDPGLAKRKKGIEELKFLDQEIRKFKR